MMLLLNLQQNNSCVGLIVTPMNVKAHTGSFCGGVKAGTDDVGQCVLRPPFTQVIKSCRTCRQGSCASGFARCSRTYEARRTPNLTCALSRSLSLLICVLILVVFSRSHPPTLSHCISHSYGCLWRFHLILSGPLHYFSRSFPQEEPRSYLGYVGFGELKSHFTNSQSASPEESAGYLKQSHHWPGFVRWSDAQWESFTLCRLFNANLLHVSPFSRLSPSSLFSLSSLASCSFTD